MKIVIAGGSGFLGQSLAAHFESLGCAVAVLSRFPTRENEKRWDGINPGEWSRQLDGAQAVINLSGKSVNCRYTAKNRAEILSSRLDSTRAIGAAIDQCLRPPRVWINASTATIYKHTYGNPHDEAGEIGAHPEADDAFSIDVALAWEKALNAWRTPHTRKVALRAAMVLGHGANSVFPTLARLTRLGLGGHMGTGHQFVSWIHETDFCRAVQWIIEHDDLNGPINLASPNPLTNREMMRHLREVLRVPIGLPAARWMLKIGALLLRTETELILKSRRVISRRLPDSGFPFQYTQIREAFKDLAAPGK